MAERVAAVLGEEVGNVAAVAGLAEVVRSVCTARRSREVVVVSNPSA